MAGEAEVAALNLRLEATLARYERALSRAEQKMAGTGRRIQRHADTLDQRLAEVGSRFGINLSPRIIASTTAIAAVGKTINDVIRNGDRLRQLEGRFKALTGSATRAGELIRGAFEIGAETGIGFETAAESITRFTIAAEAIGATDAQVLQLSENIAKLGLIGGGTAQEIQAGTIQLGQALASGRLQGDELRSVLENIPLVARQIADGLGVGVGQLREMAKQGELTADKVFRALLSGTSEIERKFAAMPQTVQLAAGQLATAWARFTSELDKSLGISDALIASLNVLSKTLDSLSGKEASDALNRSIANASLAQLRRIRAQIVEEAQVNPFSAELAVPRSSSITAGELAAVDARIAAITDEQQRRANTAAVKGANDIFRPGPGAPTVAPTPQRPPFDLGVPEPGRGSERDRQAAAQMLDAIRERIDLLGQEQELAGKNTLAQAVLTAEFERQRIVREFMQLATRDNVRVTPEQIAQAEELAQKFKDEAVALAVLNDALENEAERQREAQKAAEEHAQTIRDISQAITDAIIQADNFSDALRNVALSLANIVIQRGADAIASGLSGAIGGIFGSIFGGSGIAPAIVPGFASARGNAFNDGRVIPFARGGVVSAPTVFPMANGLGLMGEAGPEAVLPLRRGRGGKLGVAAAGGGNVEVNVFAPPGSQVTERRERAGDLERINVMIDQAVASSLGTPGRMGNRVLTNGFGARQQLVRR